MIISLIQFVFAYLGLQSEAENILFMNRIVYLLHSDSLYLLDGLEGLH